MPRFFCRHKLTPLKDSPTLLCTYCSLTYTCSECTRLCGFNDIEEKTLCYGALVVDEKEIAALDPVITAKWGVHMMSQEVTCRRCYRWLYAHETYNDDVAIPSLDMVYQRSTSILDKCIHWYQEIKTFI